MRNDLILNRSYRLDSAADSTKPLFEGAVGVLSTTGPIPSLSAGTPYQYGIVQPADALADDGGFTYCGIVDVTGFTGSPLFNVSNPGTTNLPLALDKNCPLQLLGFAKCKGLPSTQFLFGEDVGFLPNYRQNGAGVELGGGWVVPLRLFPAAERIGKSRDALTTSALTLVSGVIQHQQSSDFITVELLGGVGAGKADRLIGSYFGDSAALTGAGLGAATEGAFGTAGGAIPANDVAQIRCWANLLKAGSLLVVEGQVRFTGQAGADTAIVRLRYGGLTGQLLATTGPTKVYAAGDVATLRGEMLVSAATSARIVNASGVIGAPSGIAAQSVGGAVANTATPPAITSDRMIVATIEYSANAAGDTAVLESLTARVIR